MKNRYKLHKRYRISALGVAAIIIVILIVMNTGYALWSSKLNIHGKVDLSLNPPKLEVEIPQVGSNVYTHHIGFSNDEENYFKFISDEYSDNSLVTTIKVNSELNEIEDKKEIGINFSIKNTSGNTLTEGMIKNKETSNPGGAVTGISTNLSKKTIAQGDSTVFNFQATIDTKQIKDNTYFRYSISYTESGITKYFYYTIKII